MLKEKGDYSRNSYSSLTRSFLGNPVEHQPPEDHSYKV